VSKVEFLNYLSEILEVPAGSLSGNDKLADLEEWTSVAMVSFIAFADEHFGKMLSPRLFTTCDTIDDLGKLVGITDSTGSPVAPL
jgi:acyl carrier protein